MKYLMEDPKNYKREIEIPKELILQIQRDYSRSTYYWSVGILCTVIGFLLGVIA